MHTMLTMQKILLVLEDQGGAFIRWNRRELAPALRAQMDGHPPVVVIENGKHRDESVCDT